MDQAIKRGAILTLIIAGKDGCMVVEKPQVFGFESTATPAV
jgi:hypothetical protein